MKQSTIDILQTLSHPMRLEILERLRDGPRTMQELADALPIKAASVYSHLQHFQEVGLLEVERRGRTGYYKMNLERLAGAMANFARSVGIKYPPREAPTEQNSKALKR